MVRSLWGHFCHARTSSGNERRRYIRNTVIDRIYAPALPKSEQILISKLSA